MHLWNDYEGKTLAGTFPIETLLRTEGRNASFSTHDRSGRPAVLRLTEALNDQQEMRARFEAIRDMGQRNLVAIEDFGDVEMDGTPLIYLVMESTQENLADILHERRLTIEETGEIAASLVAALEALHAHGLVHGQVEPASVLAVGQVVKLRSDCVRPAPAGLEGERARAEDVFGLADVLHRSLTQQRLQGASDALALPEPYASIVRNVVRGSWGIDEVASEVRRFVRPAAAQPSPGTADEVAVSNQMPAAGEISPRAAADQRRTEPDPLASKEYKASFAGSAQLPLMYTDAAEDDALDFTGDGRWREPRTPQRDRMPMLLTLGAAGLCLLLLLAWHFTGNSTKGSANAAGLPTPAYIAPPSAVTAAPGAAAAKAAASAHTPAAAPQQGQVWRVVAYTYNVETQAQAKVRLIAERHRELDPQVYSRTGHAPFLVTLGGTLTQQQAATMRDRARSQGLARDMYIQNYSR